MTARPIGTRSRAGGTREAILDILRRHDDRSVDDLATKTELKAVEQRLTIRLLATVGGGAGIVLAGMGVATAIILAAD